MKIQHTCEVALFFEALCPFKLLHAIAYFLFYSKRISFKIKISTIVKNRMFHLLMHINAENSE